MSVVEKIRVLIVEDHLITRVGVETIINTQPDMTVIAEAASAVQAIELHAKHRPDVTLMDIRMPGMTGVEAILAIRAKDPNARIIALSTYGGDEDVRRALAAGARSYLTKDVLHDELIRTIHIVHSGKAYLSPSVAAVLEAESLSGLSARELEVLKLIAKGFGNQQIAYELGIAVHTVKNHVKHILTKLHVVDRTQATAAAIQRGIIHL